MILAEIQSYLKGIGKEKSPRTLERWFKSKADDEHSRPKQYSIETVENVLLYKGIPEFYFKYHPQGTKNPKQPSKEEFEQKKQRIKERLILDFLLQKIGYKFLEDRLNQDLCNEISYGREFDKHGLLMDENLKQLYEPSVNRLDNLDTKHTKYYFRKIRSDKKRK